MDNEENLNIPHPDPAWDYYIEWHKLIRAKAQLDKLIDFISSLESATEANLEILQQDTAIIISTLESI